VCFLTTQRSGQRYTHDMQVWLRLRDSLPTSWLEIRYEDCVADLEDEARRALDFLELPWDPKVLEYRERLKAKAVSSPTYEAVSKPLYTSAIGRWKNYQKFLEPCLGELAPMVEVFQKASVSTVNSVGTLAAMILILAFSILTCGAAETTSDGVDYFESKVRPIFAEHC